MIQYIESDCPGCGRHLRIRSEYLGSVIQCNHCDQYFLFRAANDPTTTQEVFVHPPDREARVRELLAELAARGAALDEAGRQLAGSRAQTSGLEEQVVGLREALDLAEAKGASDADEIRALQALGDQLSEEAGALRDQLAARAADGAHALQRLEQELGAIRTERDLIDAERRAQAAGRERLEEELRLARRSLGQAVEDERAARAAIESEFEAASARRDAEQEERLRGWQAERQALLDEARQAREEAHDRAESEWRGRLAAAERLRHEEVEAAKGGATRWQATPSTV